MSDITLKRHRNEIKEHVNRVPTDNAYFVTKKIRQKIHEGQGSTHFSLG